MLGLNEALRAIRTVYGPKGLFLTISLMIYVSSIGLLEMENQPEQGGCNYVINWINTCYMEGLYGRVLIDGYTSNLTPFTQASMKEN